MRKVVMVLVSMLVVLPGAAFGSYEDCMSECNSQCDAGMAKAKTYVNDIEVQDAAAECQRLADACTKACRDVETHPQGQQVEQGQEQQQQ